MKWPVIIINILSFKKCIFRAKMVLINWLIGSVFI